MDEGSGDENKPQGTGPFAPVFPVPDRQTNMAACHIRKNLLALRQFPRVALNNIRDLPEAFQPVGAILTF